VRLARHRPRHGRPARQRLARPLAPFAPPADRPSTRQRGRARGSCVAPLNAGRPRLIVSVFRSCPLDAGGRPPLRRVR
jgi:hypothetical protein